MNLKPWARLPFLWGQEAGSRWRSWAGVLADGPRWVLRGPVGAAGLETTEDLNPPSLPARRAQTSRTAEAWQYLAREPAAPPRALAADGAAGLLRPSRSGNAGLPASAGPSPAGEDRESCRPALQGRPSAPARQVFAHLGPHRGAGEMPWCSWPHRCCSTAPALRSGLACECAGDGGPGLRRFEDEGRRGGRERARHFPA